MGVLYLPSGCREPLILAASFTRLALSCLARLAPSLVPWVWSSLWHRAHTRPHTTPLRITTHPPNPTARHALRAELTRTHTRAQGHDYYMKRNTK
ncbi:hypothetical protein E2C01_071910 [Portunus trituberculatus]|uniref:Uncharacterized protein n=1 Tax=Portunus trituberculatus TaxID=210409 RepID=A0A5B7I6C2_PORTR|nr:hypothetical protein [Portunus trituberculatus]